MREVEDLRFTPVLLAKPPPRGMAVETTLRHFVMLTYWVDPARLRKHLHPRFDPVALATAGNAPRSLISVVTFFDRDFRFVACPRFRMSFGQTNYRAYAQDTETGEQVVWFFGTCLDSFLVTVPRHVWKLPWHRAHMTFDCMFDETASRYSRFRVSTRSRWAPGQLSVTDSGAPVRELSGFSSLEAGLVLLTHPLRGYFFRRDGALGSYSIWHDRMKPSAGSVEKARYPLLAKLDLVREGDLSHVHSVLLQPRIDFTIYLPPSKAGRITAERRRVAGGC